jgi:hypothetical protein
MRLFLLSVFAWLSMLGVTVGATNEQLIRRLYIDIIGLPPTIEELEWYVVYNPSNSYELAVKTMVKNYNLIGKEDYYMSSLYTEKPMEIICEEMLYSFIQYFSSSIQNIKTHKKEVCLSFIKNCKLISNDPVEVFDYMTNCLMSRSTRATEANKLLTIFRSSLKEDDGYMLVLKEILKIEDCYKK